MRRYRASLLGLKRQKLETPKKSAIVSISLGQEVHEGAKFIATLEEVNKVFDSCMIGLGDTLQRYSYASLLNSEDSCMLIAKQDGDRWLTRNLDAIKSILTIDYKILRWNDWLEDPTYPEYKKKTHELFKNDLEFKEIVTSLAENFYKKLNNSGYKINYNRSINNSILYLLEECAVACIWCDQNYDFDIYPFVRNKAINYCISKLQPVLSKHKIIPIQIKFCTIEREVSSREWQKIIDAVPAHIYYKDTKGVVLSCNLAQAIAFGSNSVDTVVGKDHTYFLNKEMSNTHLSHDSEIILQKVSKIFEEETMINGEKKVVLSHKAPMIEKGKIVGIVGVSIDITQQKKLEKELIKKTKSLEQMLDQSKRFLNNMSHEIRTPLHGIVNAAHFICNENTSCEDRKTMEEILSKCSERLMKYVSDILDLAKSSQYKESYDFKEFDIVSTISYCINEYAHLLEIDFKKPKPIYIRYDDIKIKRVMVNILLNAVQYGKDRNVFVNLEKEKDGVKISVTSSGHIQATELSKIFEPFYQSEKTRTDAGGTGLGLAICKEIMIAHKSSIWAESKDGKVSFIFKLKFNL